MNVVTWLRRLEAVVAGTLLLAMVGLIFAGGLGRILHSPINWTIDLATCCFAGPASSAATSRGATTP